VLQLAAAEHAFKTPSLREALHTAPYMHDGSLATLTDVLRHYERGIVDRPSLPPDLKRGLTLTESERAALLAFLATLSSEQPPAPPTKIVPAAGPTLAPAMRAITISQSEKQFHPTHVAIARGGRLWIVNNDTRTHNVRVFDPAMDYDSGAQEPGETIEIAFAKSGTFLVTCGIHPQMELTVEVRGKAK
jgi:cytochrome c peroxidase